MAQIAPLRGIRYDPARLPNGDLSAVIAPPYDVLSQADRDALLARSDRNIVAIDLPHMPPGYAGPAEVYVRAADTMRGWLDDGTLIQEPAPVLYVYHQRYILEGRPITRRMLMCRLRIEPFGRGSVFPHEQTFGGPKEDRLLLTRATQCNLSPIFGLYPDPDGAVAKLLDMADRTPTARGSLGDVDNLIWTVDDVALIDQVGEALADRAVFIADGHHRYGTAQMYRDEVMTASDHSISDEHPAHYVLMVLCAMEDDGLQILPTHRLLTGIDVQVAVNALDAQAAVELSSISPDAGDPVEPGTFRLIAGTDAWLLRVNGPEVLSRLEPDRSDAWRRLDLAVLHRYLIDEVIQPALGGADAPETRYIKDAAHGRTQAAAGDTLLIETAATSLNDLSEVCRAGELMPQKSTYFYPKLATGLVINPLTDARES